MARKKGSDCFSTSPPMLGDVSLIHSADSGGEGTAGVNEKLKAKRHHPDIAPGSAARIGKGTYPQGKDANL
jgi:hypothetical protein